MRPTWHILPAKDIYWMLELSAKKIRAAMRSNDRLLEITEPVFSKSNAIIEKCLQEGEHLTRDEIGLRLNKARILTNENRLSHLLIRAELEGIACSGKSQKDKRTYALLEKRVPRPPTIDKHKASAILATRYFTSHGPATLQDFAWWSGLTLTDAKHGLEESQSKLVSEKIKGDEYWFDRKLKLTASKNESIHFLPAYDEFIISYTDRSASLIEEHRKKVLSNNGIFNPVIIIDGQAAGTWKRTFTKDEIIVEPCLFHQHNRSIAGKLEKALSRIGDFYNKNIILTKPVIKK